MSKFNDYVASREVEITFTNKDYTLLKDSSFFVENILLSRYEGNKPIIIVNSKEEV